MSFNLNNKHNDKPQNTPTDWQHKFEKLHQNYMELGTNFATLQSQQSLNTANEQLAVNPLFEFNLDAQRQLNGSYQNYINLWNVRESQMGGGGELGGYSFLIYLLILERARYFKHRVIFEGINDSTLNWLMYEVLYHTALNGCAGLYFLGEQKRPIVVAVQNTEYDLFGNLTKVQIMPVNVYNSSEWNYESQTLYGSQCQNLAILRQNNENFGLWVVAWFYLKKVCQYFNILNYQVVFINKKLGVENDKQLDQNMNQVYQSLINPDIAVVMTPDLDKIKTLDMPQIDLNQIFELIINFQNYFDTHILGIRTKDIDPSAKAREIVANQGVVAQQQSKQEQSQSIFLEQFLNQVNLITGLNISYQDTNITLNDEILGDSITDNKITTGNEGQDD